MGITNFCKLLNPLFPPSVDPIPFDSLLIDCQSFLYCAIDHILETDETLLFQEICQSTWAQIRHLLNTFTAYACASLPLTVVLSFDGEGVPMKWATQRERRNQQKKTTVKSFYRYILFGNNKLTTSVQNYVVEQLKASHYRITFVVAGCNVPGEGEHKMFHLTRVLSGCHHPVIISVDQDVFILALLRLNDYRSIQIYRYKRFYHVANLASSLPYPLQRFMDVTFLFGNDFIPVVIGISPHNIAFIHQALSFDDSEGDPPAHVAAFLCSLQDHIRYDVVEFIDRPLIVCFWITYFWILDYYTQRHFPQQFLENRVYDAFDRNQIITALTNETYSRSAFREAQKTYEDTLTQPIPHAEHHIFTDLDLLKRLQSYWTKPENTLCTVVRLTSSQ